MKKKKICLITPSFGTGGAERVLSGLANYFVDQKNLVVHFIILTGGKKFYDLDDRIIIHEPKFNYSQYSRIIFTFKIFKFLRSKLNQIKPSSTLSFGGKYNAFVLISAVGLNLDIFVSDRSRPDISYGRFLDFINPKVYKLARGIIAQTENAKLSLESKLKHQNIKVIGNPIRTISNRKDSRENIILNVGRFIESKQQEVLIDLFEQMNPIEWKLVFLGEGPKYDEIRHKAKIKKTSNRIFFQGNVKDVDEFYKRSKIFALTSVSEGFPNVLGEAMSAGCACISFDCNSGPSDLIKNSLNGYLIDLNNLEEYRNKLETLMSNTELRVKFGKRAKQTIKEYDINNIGEKFYRFMFKKNYENTY